MSLTLRKVWDRFGPVLTAGAVLLALVAVSTPSEDGGGSSRLAAEGGGGDGSAATASEVTSTTVAEAAAGTSEPTAPGVGGPSAGGGRPGAGRSGGGSPGSGSPGGGGLTGCRSDGRMSDISYWAPPCKPVFTGDNGGATARGVTRDEIRVAFYIPPEDETSRALEMADATTTTADIQRMHDALLDYYNHHAETYKRRVVLVPLRASGPPSDERAARSDAIKAAEDIKAFAVWTRTGELPEAFVDEATARGVICIQCGFLKSRDWFVERAGKVYSRYPHVEYYYEALAEYIGKRLARRTATWAGDEFAPRQGFKAKQRTFGLIYTEAISGGAPNPDAKKGVEFFERELAKYGVQLVAKAAYISDLSRAPATAPGIILQMKNAGATTVACVCDPFYPIYFTQEASRQDYYPEWLSTGILLNDTTFFGRLYDSKQWRHFFGLSTNLLPEVSFEHDFQYRVYHHMRPDARPGDDEGAKNGGPKWNYLIFFTGVHMAGPNLTPETFARGMYSYPVTGGTPTTPVAFYRPDNPSLTKDFAEVWWDPETTGQDEQGTNGPGVLWRSDGGRRYRPGQWPTSDPKVFDRTGAVLFEADKFAHGAHHEDDGHRHDLRKRCRSCL